MILENENTIRKFENTDYFGYLFHVSYDGLMFDSFDENPDMVSVKSKFRELLESNNIKFYKGIQQAGRTDKDVSASNNILYINSKQDIKLSGLKNFKTDGLTITKIEKTMPFLELPSLIKSRHYVYKYPTDKIANTKDEIIYAKKTEYFLIKLKTTPRINNSSVIGAMKSDRKIYEL